MINLKDYRDNPQRYIKGAADKRVQVDWDRFAQLDEQVRGLKFQLDELNAQRNTLSKEIEEKQKA